MTSIYYYPREASIDELFFLQKKKMKKVQKMNHLFLLCTQQPYFYLFHPLLCIRVLFNYAQGHHLMRRTEISSDEDGEGKRVM
jgi:hypothetical protein